MTDERRRYERVDIPLEARWEGLAGRQSARISDISLGGCYVETLGQVAEGEQINFEIRLPTERWLRLRGIVAHYYPNLGFGVRFFDLTAAEQDVLARLLEYVRGD